MNPCINAQLHEVNEGEMIRKTVIYNPGRFRDDRWLEMHINKSEIKTILHEQP